MVDIRKIAKWYNLKWSNTLAKKLPKFQHDVLVISNRLLNNSDFMKTEKFLALRELSLQTQNPYFLSGMLKVFGYHWKFEDINRIMKKYKDLNLPFPEDVRENLVRFCVLRLKKPPLTSFKPEVTNENMKDITEAIQIFNEMNPADKIPFIKDDGSIKITLEDYINYHKFKLPEDFNELTGQILTNQQYSLMVELYDKYYYLPEAKRAEGLFRAMKSYNALEKYDKTIELMHDALNSSPLAAISTDLWNAVGEVNGHTTEVKELVAKGIKNYPKDKPMSKGLQKLEYRISGRQETDRKERKLREKKEKAMKFNYMIDEIIDEEGKVHINPDKEDDINEISSYEDAKARETAVKGSEIYKGLKRLEARIREEELKKEKNKEI
jgi:hypothetical protein